MALGLLKCEHINARIETCLVELPQMGFQRAESLVGEFDCLLILRSTAFAVRFIVERYESLLVAVGQPEAPANWDGVNRDSTWLSIDAVDRFMRSDLYFPPDRGSQPEFVEFEERVRLVEAEIVQKYSQLREFFSEFSGKRFSDYQLFLERYYAAVRSSFD